MHLSILVNALLILACVQNVTRHYWNMWQFRYSAVCMDDRIRESGGPLLTHLCQYYARLSDFTSIENLATTIVHLNYHLIIVMILVVAASGIGPLISAVSDIPPRYRYKPGCLQ